MMIFKLRNLRAYWAKWYGTPEFYELVKKGYILDARLGGLITGPSHFRGGIFCYIQSGSLFEIGAEIEGGEFIVNPISSARYNDRLQAINSDADGPRKKMTRSENGKVFNIRDNKNEALWLNYGEVFIINARSTAKYYDELVSINSFYTVKYDAKARNSDEWEWYSKLDSEGRFYSTIGEPEDKFIEKIRSKKYLSSKLYG